MILLSILGIAFFLCLAAFFDASEIAIISVNRVYIKRLISEGNRAAKFVEKLTSSPEWILSSTLFYADISIISATSILEHLMQNYLPERYSIFVSSIIMSILIILFTQIIPKSFGLKHSRSISIRVSHIIRIFSIILYPLVKFVQGVINLIRLMGFKIPHKKQIITRAEVILSLDKSAVVSPKKQYIIDMMSSSFFLAETAIIDIMIDIEDYPGLSVESTVDEALKLMERSGVENTLVYSNEGEDILGIVYVKNLLDMDKDRVLSDFIRTPLTFYQTVSPTEILDDLRKHQTKLAFIYEEAEDEDKSEIVGVVTIDDIIQQVVGEM